MVEVEEGFPYGREAGLRGGNTRVFVTKHIFAQSIVAQHQYVRDVIMIWAQYYTTTQ